MRFLMILMVVIGTACGGDSKNTPSDGPPTVDTPPDGSELDCFPNPDPLKHNEIINACTTAQKIKIEDLRGPPSKLNADGSLPDLP